MSIELLLERRSIRKYSGEAVGAEELKKLLEAAMAAPSAKNRQPWHFVLIQEKETLETLLVPHRVEDGEVYFEEAEKPLERCLALDKKYVEAEEGDTLRQVNVWAGFTVKEKAYVYVGARMGRPEKAKERKMNPYVHSIFPVGNAGGPQRDITRAK